MANVVTRRLPLYIRALPEKWEPVFGQEVRKNKSLEHLCDSDLSGNALTVEISLQEIQAHGRYQQQI